MSDSLQLHEQWPTRLLCPWDFNSKNTGMGCRFLPQGSSSSNPGIKLMSPVLAGGFFTTMLPRKPRLDSLLFLKYSRSVLACTHSFVWDTLFQIPTEIAVSLTSSDLGSNVPFLVKSPLIVPFKIITHPPLAFLFPLLCHFTPVFITL